jgi:predicted CoA-binding protein
LSQEEIQTILKTSKTIAVVGLSRNPAKYSYGVAQYLQSVGYRIIPVNPFADEILGENATKASSTYPKLYTL